MQTKLWQTASAGDDFLIIPNAGAVRNAALTVFNVALNNRSGGTRYLHCFADLGTGAVPSNGAVPILPPLQVATAATGSMAFENGVKLVGPGLIFACSTTKDTFTASGADTNDIYVVTEALDFHEPVGTVLTAGDYTTGRTNLQVWADSAGPKTLFRLEVRETAGNAIYVQLFFKDSPSEGDVPFMFWPLGVAGRLDITFGEGGNKQFGVTSAFVQQDGCTVVFSTTGPTKTIVGANAGTIKATYI